MTWNKSQLRETSEATALKSLWNCSVKSFLPKKNADFEQQQQKTKKRSDHQASIWVGTTTDWSTQVCVCVHVCECVSVWVCEVWVGGNGATSCSQELPASRFSLGPRRPPFSHFFPFGFFWILFKKDIFGGGFYFCRVVRRLPPRRQLGSALVVVQCHVSIGHLAALSTFSAQFSHANFEFPYPPFAISSPVLVHVVVWLLLLNISRNCIRFGSIGCSTWPGIDAVSAVWTDHFQRPFDTFRTVAGPCKSLGAFFFWCPVHHFMLNSASFVFCSISPVIDFETVGIWAAIRSLLLEFFISSCALVRRKSRFSRGNLSARSLVSCSSSLC